MITAIQRYLASTLGADPLLRNAAFLRYWFSSILNSFGAQVSALAVPLCSAILLQATPGQMSLVATCQALPALLFSLPAGVWLDRRRKLPILLACQVIQGLCLASIPLAWWLGILSMPWLYASTLVFHTCNVIGGGAEQIFVMLVVGRDKLIDAQSKFTMTDSASRLIAPGLAGLLIQWLTAPYAVLANAASFLLSAWNLRQTNVTEPAPQPSEKHPLREIREGFVFIWNTPLLRTLAWSIGLWHMLYYGFAALQILLATRELGMTPGLLGVAQMLGGLGMLASSMLVKPMTRRFGAGKTMLTGIAATVLGGFVLQATIPANWFGQPLASAAAYALLVFVYDCGVMLFFIPYLSMRAHATPDAYMGRIISTMRFLTVATAPLGALAAGAIADRYGVRTGLACVGACGMLLTAAMIASPHIRSVRPD
ncbi:MFS transporter [Pseudoduganella rivuli]|uniref:MFS transporter n=1 Tax=Pseudoduganella rivuli TaxID=2666085 RepID=UPI001E39C78B|nr:MFS transporter [Pseudoduganella rivuli]